MIPGLLVQDWFAWSKNINHVYSTRIAKKLFYLQIDPWLFPMGQKFAA